MAVPVAFVLHNHQPVGNLDPVVWEATRRAYRPFLDALARHPSVRISMHWSGSLLEWLEANDPGVIDRIGALAAGGQVELLTGAFYEPILPAIPEWDRHGQIARMNEYLARRFGAAPKGAWIPERVWEPDLPDTLARAGVQYVLLDDHHFLLAGEPAASLREPYWVEGTEGRVGVYPIERELRYRMPFEPVPELLQFLESTHAPGDALRIFGDDGEKFGVWPRTHEWVYGGGWLEAWLAELESGRRVRAVPLDEAWRARPPWKRVALPAASYPEMMLWALPPEAQLASERDQEWLVSQGRADLARRVAAGTWRAFPARYPESRRALHRVNGISARIERLRRSGRMSQSLEDARREVHRAQCNCSYWHGVFGGFYLPHLRQAVHEHRIRAESLADRHEGELAGWIVDRDGQEIRLRSPRLAVGVDLEGRGAIVEIADRARAFEFVSGVARRREAYHERVRAAATAAPAGSERPETIHGGLLVKEAGLERLLSYDDRLRAAAQEWFLARRDVDGGGGLGASIDSAGDGITYRPDPNGSTGLARITLRGRTPGGIAELRKHISGGPEPDRFRVDWEGESEAGGWLLTEWNLSLLTPDAPGRRLVLSGREPGAFAPGSSGSADGVDLLVLEDAEHLGVSLSLRPEPAARLEWAPVETVSLSEAGAERIYQATALWIAWDCPPGRVGCSIAVRVEAVSRGA